MLKYLLANLAIYASVAVDWTYTDNNWAELYTTCSGNRQSPINIQSSKAVAGNEDPVNARDVIAFTQNKQFSFSMTNTSEGHALKFSFTTEHAFNNVKCPQFHFHIDQSEHSIDDHLLFGEYHMVCYRSDKYADLGAAVASGDKNALAVFGFWVDMDPSYSENVQAQAIIDAVSTTPEGADDISLAFPVPEGIERSSYFRYDGGLTTPTCNQVVLWTVFETPLKISKAQYDTMKGWNDHITKNNRPVQDISGRTVYVFTAAPEPISLTTIILLVVVAGLVLIGICMLVRKKEGKQLPEQDIEQTERLATAK